MGLGLVTDDRSREEGRHYTDESAVRLHGCGAFGETKPLKHPALPAPGSCRREPVREKRKDTTGHQIHRVIVEDLREQARSHRFWVVAKELKKRAWGVNPQALKR
jgi:hypothetical protein